MTGTRSTVSRTAIAVYRDGAIDVIGDKWQLFRQPVTCTAAVLTGCKNVAATEYAEGTACVPEWGLSLPLPETELPEGVTHLGIRARKMRPAQQPGPGASGIPWRRRSTAHSPIS